MLPGYELPIRDLVKIQRYGNLGHSPHGPIDNQWAHRDKEAAARNEQRRETFNNLWRLLDHRKPS